jgi:hypothetical protein
MEALAGPRLGLRCYRRRVADIPARSCPGDLNHSSKRPSGAAMLLPLYAELYPDTRGHSLPDPRALGHEQYFDRSLLEYNVANVGCCRMDRRGQGARRRFARAERTRVKGSATSTMATRKETFVRPSGSSLDRVETAVGRFSRGGVVRYAFTGL